MSEKKCIETIWVRDSWSGRREPCGRKAKYGDYCGIHSPEKKAERAKKRGHTRWERDMALREASNERIRIAARNAALDEIAAWHDIAANLHRGDYGPDYTSRMVHELSAAHARSLKTE
jgi:hypothetical protein